MTLPSSFLNLLKINTEDQEVLQKGKLVQTIIFALTLAWLLLFIFVSIRIFTDDQYLAQGISILITLLPAPLIAVGGLLLVRNGRSSLAAHLTFILVNTAIFTYLLQVEEPHSIPNLMLISIVAIATMASVRASIVYTILISLSISGYYFIKQPSSDYVVDLINFISITFAISFVAWLTADSMQKWLRESSQLTQQLKEQTSQLQHRAQQLQRGAAIGQSTSNILNLDDVLKETVHTISDQFSAYFTAVYLLNQPETKLVLAESVGGTGNSLDNHHIEVDIESPTIISSVAQSQKSYLSHNPQKDPLIANDSFFQKTQTLAAFPLIARGKLLGVLDIQSSSPDAFQEEDIAILQIMANHIAINVENASLFSQTKSYLAETQSLLNLNNALTSTMDVGEIYRRASRIFSNQFQANITLITDWDQLNDIATSQIMHIRKGEEQNSEFNLNPFAFPLAHFPSLSNILAQQTVYRQRVNDPAVTHAEKNFFETHEQAFCLMIPLAHGAAPMGSILIFRSENQSEFTQSDTQVAQVMANETAIALNNAKLTSEAQGRVAQLSALNRLSNRLSLAPTMHSIFEGTRREVLSLFEATSMSVSLLTKDQQKIRWIYGYEYGQEIDLPEDPLPITKGFTGQVIRTRRHLLINENIAEKSEQFGSLSVGADSSAWLGVPLIVANKIIGVLVIENEYDAEAFDERDINLLETIAGSTAIAISNQLQLEELQTALAAQSEQRLQLQTAAEVSTATNSILNLDELLKEAVSLIKERFSLYYTGIFLSDPTTNQAVLQAATGEAGRVQLENGHKLLIGGRSLIGGTTGDGRSRITQDVTQDEEWQPNPHLPDTRSELALPLKVRGNIIGALTVQSDTAHAFSPELVGTLQTMSDQLATAIDNSRLLAAAESRVKRQQILNKISTQLHNTADTNEIIRIGLKALSDQVNGRSVNIALGKPATQTDLQS